MAKPRPLHEQIYAQLRDALMAGDFAPGEQLTIRKMAESLGTSMMPVREAVRRLAALNALEILPKRFVRVVPLTVGHFVEVAEMRKLLEGRAASVACEKASRAELQRVKKINDRLIANASSGSPNLRQLMKMNQQFHIAVYECAHSDLLLETISHLWLKIGPYLSYVLGGELQKRKKAPVQAFDHHAELLEALGKGDSEGAVSAIHADIDEGTHSLLGALDISWNRDANLLTLAGNRSEGIALPKRREVRDVLRRSRLST